MPCYSASNIHYGATVDHQKSCSRERARTAYRSTPNYRFNAVENGVPVLRAVRGPCSARFFEKTDAGTKLRRQFEQLRVAMPCPKSYKQTMLPHKELNRIKHASRIIKLDERLDALMKQEQETKRLDMEVEQTRQRFKEIDDARKKAMNGTMKEDRNESEKLQVLERAFLAKHEQDEEIRNVNRIILNAKCHAVRDAQIQERKDLEKEMKSAVTRLEKGVLERAIKQLNDEDEQFEKQKVVKKKYANDIKQQLQEREMLRNLETERLEEEAKILREANMAIKLDEERQAQMERERRVKFRADLAKVADMSAMMKKILCEQEKLAELRIAAYMQERKEREAQLKLEKKIAKEAFERKQQRLYTLAQKIVESKTQREEMAYLREQEKMEREYREKEKQSVIRKVQIERQLVEAREVQLQEIKCRQALQIAQAEQDFAELLDYLKREEEKQQKMSVERKNRLASYRMDIIRQMGDKEMERRRLIEMERDQANACRDIEKQRDANIRTIINAKMAAMREACLPEKYIKEVEKRLKKIAPMSNLGKNDKFDINVR